MPSAIILPLIPVLIESAEALIRAAADSSEASRDQKKLLAKLSKDLQKTIEKVEALVIYDV